MDKNYNLLNIRRSSLFNTSGTSWFGSLLLLFIVVVSQSLTAQVSTYSFAESTETYAQITGTTSTAIGDDGVQNGIPIGFSFLYGGTAYTTFSITTNGMIKLGGTITNGWTNGFGNPPLVTDNRPLIAVFWDDNNLGSGTITYSTTGTAPNRVLTVNWHDTKIGSTGSAGGASVSTLLRLYETTDVIEMVYSTPFTTSNAVSASVGLNDLTSFLSVTPAAVSTASSVTANNSINATVMANLAGKKLTFTPPPPPACPVPNTVTVTITSATTATVSWLGAPTAIVEWGVSGCAAGTDANAGVCGNVLSGTSPIVITGLTSGQAYSIYVRQDCTGSSNGFSTNTAVSYTHTLGESCALVDVLTVYPNVGAAVNTLLTTGLTSDGPNGTCSDVTGNPSKKDRWISFVAPASGNKVIISTSAGTLTDTVMQVWAGCPATGVALGCNDDISTSNFMSQLEFCSLTPGATYYIQIWPYSSTATGNFNVRVYEDVVCPTPPANDECAGVETILVGAAGSCPASATLGTTVNATATPGVQKTTCDQFGTYNDVFYKFNSGSNTELSFAFTNLTGTNEFGIYSACGSGYLGACSSTSLTTVYSGLTANTDYYIVVWANSAVASGTFSICISQLPPPLCVTTPTTPANAGSVCAGTTNFSWPAVASATAYDVYLDGNLVSDNQTTTTYSTTVSVGPHTWSVVPSNSTGEATGCTDFTFTSTPSPEGNTFLDPIDLGVITASTSTSGTNLTANCFTNEYTTASLPGDVNASTGNDVFCRFEITECGSTLTIGTCTSSFDTYIHLLDNSGVRINGDDDDCDAPNSSGSLMTGLTLAPGIYYVVVESFNASSSGTFTLEFDYTAGTPKVPYYADADDDGYGVTEDFILACEPSGNFTALLSGDCNDNNPLINPGATEVCFDGIDQNCDGSDSDGCPVVVTITRNCGVTLSQPFASILCSVPNLSAYGTGFTLGYRFKVTNTATNVTVELDRTVNNFNLSLASNFAYNTAFIVEAAAIVNGFVQPYLGSSCTITTPAIVTNQLSSTQCGTTLPELNSRINASAILGAIHYRFRIALSDAPTTYEYYISPYPSMRLNVLNQLPLNYGKTYLISVQALYTINGVEGYSDFGTECSVSTPPVSSVVLSPSACGQTLVASNSRISTNAVLNATLYRFRVALASNPGVTEDITGVNPSFRLSSLTGTVPFLDGTPYLVSVQAEVTIDGDVFLTTFGAPCVITTPSGEDQILTKEVVVSELQEFAVLAYPNPFRDAFALNIKTSATAPIQMAIYDMTGRLLETKSLTVDQATNTSIGSNYPSGVYQVVVSQGDQLQTVRVIKQ